MSLNVYLHFREGCREAFEFYRAVFGGEFDIFQTFGDGPPDMDMGVPEAERDNVMHVSYSIGGTVLMGSDVPSAFGPAPEQGNNFSISYSASSREEADAVFGKLSEGGAVTMPLQDMFWGSYFGSCTDRFGINWMVSRDEHED